MLYIKSIRWVLQKDTDFVLMVVEPLPAEQIKSVCVASRYAASCNIILSFFLLCYDQLLLFEIISAQFMMHTQKNVPHHHSESKLSSLNETWSFLLQANEKRISILHITEFYILALFILLSLHYRIKILIYWHYLDGTLSTSPIYMNFPGGRCFKDPIREQK